MPEIWTVLLAAGGSGRLGQPKQALPMGKESLLQHAVTQACAATPGRVVCVLGAYQPQTPLPCLSCHNPQWQSGMASSLLAGLNQLPDGVSILVTLCDQPAVTATELCLLIDTHQQHPDATVAARYGETVGVPAVFPALMRARLMELSGDQGARALLRDPSTHLLTLSMAEAAQDIDTQADWQEWLAVRNLP